VVLFALAVDYLDDGYVHPDRGTTATPFTYWVYWNGGEYPPTAYVYIDDMGAVMMTYDGEIGGSHRYKHTTTLPSGDHDFYFGDSIGGVDPDVGKYVGPYVEGK